MVKVVALDTPVGEEVHRLGFLIGQIHVPDDFDQISCKEIEQLFDGDL